MSSPRGTQNWTWIIIIVLVAALGILMFFVGPKIVGG
jgi:hypothetical protein